MELQREEQVENYRGIMVIEGRCSFASIEMRLFSREGRSIELLVYLYEILAIFIETITTIEKN